MKECAYCKENKELSKFSKHPKRHDGLDHRCKDCVNKHSKVWKKIDKEVRLSGEFDKEFNRLNGKCPICESDMIKEQGKTHNNSAVIDHCHTLNIYRGILCRKCNQALGSLGDNIKALKRAINYLSREIQ